MLILGIDTSCDDTSAAVVENGSRTISSIVSGQADIHSRYGGIVPELASRRHIEMIIPVVDEALKSAGLSLKDMDAVAVCEGPGLIGSLLVGCSFAKAACFSSAVPLVAVNHLEGHLLSPFLEYPDLRFPFISLVVSGGHTSIYEARDFGDYKELGRTRDDAAGEAYDKVSKILGLGYPGGPLIDRLAGEGDPSAIDFPRAYLQDTLDFSFSGIKTAVLNHVNREKMKVKSQKSKTGVDENNQLPLAEIAASFQSAVVDVLVRKVQRAIRITGIKRVVISGGVAANSLLRRRIKDICDEKGAEAFIPSLAFCTDNAAMIAAAGYNRFNKGLLAGPDLNPRAYLPL